MREKQKTEEMRRDSCYNGEMQVMVTEKLQEKGQAVGSS